MSYRVRAFVALLALLTVAPVVPGGPLPAAASEPVLVTTLGLNDPIVGTSIAGLGGSSPQYRHNNQRNYWWNAQRQRWDAVLPTASPPASTDSAWWIWHDVGGTPTPIGLVETSTGRTPDAYWDASTQTLFVFFSRGDSGTSKFRRFVYDGATDRYIEVSRSGGVDAPTNLRGGSRVTITKSPNGYLWAGVNYQNQLLISRSTDGGDTWPAPVAIKATAMSGEGHWVVFDEGGRSRVAFAATEDGQAPGGDPKVHFVHIDQDEPDWANPARWTDETSLLPAWEGDERADDELSAVVFENRAFVVIETEPLGDSRSATRPQLLVFERHVGGGWSKHVILRFSPTGGNDAKRPVVTVDAATRSLVVTAGTTQRTHADLWYAPIDSLAGRDERWSKLRVFEVSDPTTQNIYNNRLPLPRFPVTADADLLLMIDDQGAALRMWRQVVRSTGPIDPNRAPVAADDQASTPKGAAVVVDVLANDSDPDGDPLTVTNLSQPAHGTNTLNPDQTVTYTPPAGFTGIDSFTYTAHDGRVDSSPATVTITVTDQNRPPVIDPIADVTLDAGTTLTVPINAWDPDGDPVTISVQGLPAFASFDPAKREITIAPQSGDSGTYGPVTVTASDGAGSPAVAPALRSASSAIDTGTKASALTIARPAGVVAGDLLLAHVRYRDSTGGLIPPAGWTVVAVTARSQANHALLYKFAGPDEPTSYRFDQGSTTGRMAGGIGAYTGVHPTEPIAAWAGSDPDTAVLAAPGVAAAPSESLVVRLWGWRGSSALEPGVGFNAPPADMVQRWSEQVGHANTDRNRVLAADHVQATAGPVAAAVASGSASSGENRRNAFTVVLNPAGGGGGATASTSFSITVNPVAGNAPPQAVDDAAVTTVDTPVVIAVLANDTDADGNPLTVTNLSQPPSGTAVLNPDGTVTYSPAVGFAGVDSFTYTANDGQVDSNVATVTVTVQAPAPPGSAPEFVAASSAAVTGASGRLITIARPAGVQAGDLLVAQVRYRTATVGMAAPPGWTQLGLIEIDQANHAVFVRVAGPEEPAGYTFDQQVDRGRMAGGIGAYRGVDPVTPVLAWAASPPSTATLVAPDVEATVGGVRVLRLWGWRGASATEAGVGFNQAPAGMTERWSEQVGHVNTDRNRVLAADHVQSSPGPVGAATASGSASSGENRRSGFTVVLNPASG
jgi:hypothetical protein